MYTLYIRCKGVDNIGFSEDYDPLTGGAAPKTQSYVDPQKRSHIRAPRVHIPTPTTPASTAKTLVVIIIYMFCLGMVSLAFQTAYAHGTDEYAEFEDTYEGFNPNDLLDGTYGYTLGRQYIMANYFGHEYNEKTQEAYEFKRLHDIAKDEKDLDYWLGEFVKSMRDGTEFPEEGQKVLGQYLPGNEYYDEEKVEDYKLVQSVSDGDWFGAVRAFFGSIIDAFSFMLNILTLNFYPNIQIPAILTWVPFFFMLPVWVYMGMLIAPYAIAAINAIGNLIPFT